MKKFLYLDNVRGFRDEYVPLVDVNFLVGENSTGKSSFLSILKLASSPRFFFSHEFSDDDVDLGHFNDIVSIHSPNRKYFRVGVATSGPRPPKGRESVFPSAALFSYAEHDGLPRLTQFTTNFGEHAIHVAFRPAGVYYSLESGIDKKAGIQDFYSTIFPAWVRTHRRGGKSRLAAKKLGPRFGGDESGQLPFALSAIVQRDLAEGVVEEHDYVYRLMAPDFGPEIVWGAPIRTRPRRTYDGFKSEFSSEGIHTPYLIRKILTSESKVKKFKANIEAIGRSSGLFQSVAIKSYGEEKGAPFELDIELDGRALNINTVGYGVSQALPVLVEMLDRRPGTWFAIQQPEVHLHPRAQAALGDLVFQMSQDEAKRFVIETHSDFMIDRFRMNYALTNTAAKPVSQVLFFERTGRRNTVHQMAIDSKGDLPLNQPAAYREFFLEEGLRMLGL